MRTTARRLAVTAAAAGLALAGLVPPASANHPVFVEGNCFGPGTGMTASGLDDGTVPSGTCGDYDGDGMIGMAEDGDNDNNFGTITAALEAVAQNGRVLIVQSGTFPEVVTLAPVDGGNLTLEGAPGVDANIDAVVQGPNDNDPDGDNSTRQASPGIIIDGCDQCRVTVRNVMTRNWTDGVLVRGASHATLDEVRAENNTDYGIHVTDTARVAISGSDVNASGFRKNTGGVSPAMPGIGIGYEDSSLGDVYDTSVTGSRAAGVSAQDKAKVSIQDVQSFDNNPNFFRTNRGNGNGRG